VHRNIIFIYLHNIHNIYIICCGENIVTKLPESNRDMRMVHLASVKLSQN